MFAGAEFHPPFGGAADASPSRRAARAAARRHAGQRSGSLTAGVLLSLLSISPAHAEMQRFSDVVQALDSQTPTRQPASADRTPLRVQVSYQLQEVSDRAASLDAQRDSLQAAHARLYRIVGQECDVISQAFGGDCRVVSLNLGNGGQSYGPVPLTTYTASAVFEVAASASAPSKPK